MMTGKQDVAGILSKGLPFPSARAWRLLGGVLSGLLLAGAFAPFNFEWLAWVAFVPALAA